MSGGGSRGRGSFYGIWHEIKYYLSNQNLHVLLVTICLRKKLLIVLTIQLGWNQTGNYFQPCYTAVGVYIVLIKTIFNFIYCFVHYQDSVGWTSLQSFGLVQK